MTDLRKISERFYSDPEWAQVEEIILEYIEPLKDMGDIDLKQTAETVKAEVIGRITAYNALSKFLNDSKIITRPLQEVKRPFK